MLNQNWQIHKVSYKKYVMDGNGNENEIGETVILYGCKSCKHAIKEVLDIFQADLISEVVLIKSGKVKE